MERRRGFFDRTCGGRQDANVPFEQTRMLLRVPRVFEKHQGSHREFVREGIEEPTDLQQAEGGECKPCQVKQMRGTPRPSVPPAPRAVLRTAGRRMPDKHACQTPGTNA